MTDQFLAENPDVAEALGKIAALGDPPASWSRTAFNSLDAYRLVDADGVGQYARFRLEPSDDPILDMRPHLYAECVRRRTGG